MSSNLLPLVIRKEKVNFIYIDYSYLIYSNISPITLYIWYHLLSGIV